MIQIVPLTEERIDDVIAFERKLRVQEPEVYFMAVDPAYKERLVASFHDDRFQNAVSLLAYRDGGVIGRIDATLLFVRSEACCTCAYLDWICVLRSERHRSVAQRMLRELRLELGRRKVETLIAVMAHNEESKRFYKAVNHALIRDEAVWISCGEGKID